jgi:hypothetical protein
VDEKRGEGMTGRKKGKGERKERAKERKGRKKGTERKDWMAG